MRTRQPLLWWLAPLTAVMVATLALAGCGGNGDDSDETPTAEARTSLPADPLPTVEGNNVTSPGKGYSVVYPDGWEPRFNLVATPQQRIDAYFAPDDDPEEGVRANIAVTCDQIAADATLDEYFQRKRDLIASLSGSEPPDGASITVGGLPAMQLEYNQPQAEGDDLRKIDTYVVRGTCGYNISLTAEQGDVAGVADDYEAFVASFGFV